MTIAVIGAGLAGLGAARALAARGRQVVLFDKGRGPGGRLSTRRAETPLGELAFDHGAQYLTARSEGFRAVMEDLVDAGAAARWAGRLVALAADGTPTPLSPEPRYVGTPGMSAIVRALADGLDINWSCRVSEVRPDPSGLRLGFEAGMGSDPYDAVVCAVPAEQAVALLETSSPALAAEAAGARSAPCWAVMAAFDAPVALPYDGAKLDAGPLAWVARNSSKPERPPGETWVLHGSPDWSAEHLEADPDKVADVLLTAFRELTGAPAPVFTRTHRWRYAQIVTPADTPAAFDPETRIGVCGDWRIGPRAEAAWLSGEALAAII